MNLTLAPIWLPHWPAWMCTISLMLEVGFLSTLKKSENCWTAGPLACVVSGRMIFFSLEGAPRGEGPLPPEEREREGGRLARRGRADHKYSAFFPGRVAPTQASCRAASRRRRPTACARKKKSLPLVLFPLQFFGRAVFSWKPGKRWWRGGSGGTVAAGGEGGAAAAAARSRTMTTAPSPEAGESSLELELEGWRRGVSTEMGMGKSRSQGGDALKTISSLHVPTALASTRDSKEGVKSPPSSTHECFI